MNRSLIEFKDQFVHFITKELKIIWKNDKEIISYEPYSTMEYNTKQPLFIENLLEDLEKIYRFSEYYDILIQNNINTPISFILDAELMDSNPDLIDNIIKNLPNQQCFARLDSCSSKPKEPFTESDDIRNELETYSWATHHYLYEPNHKLVLREYINVENYYEIRCFVYQSKCRGITFPCLPTEFNEPLVYDFIDKVIYYTEYDACSIDILISNSGTEIMVIEINSPVWLFATSGLFDLTDKHDYELLLGDYNPDILTYPELRFP
jgi:hypothetical protein